MAAQLGSLWLQGSSQQTAQLMPVPCSQQPRTRIRKRDSLPTQCSWLAADPFCRVSNPREWRRSLAASDSSCPCSTTKHRISCHCVLGGNKEADQLSRVGSKLEQSVHPMSYSKAKAILRNSLRAMPKHWNIRGRHPPAGQSSSSHNL